jgi:hypothetical protein
MLTAFQSAIDADLFFLKFLAVIGIAAQAA